MKKRKIVIGLMLMIVVCATLMLFSCDSERTNNGYNDLNNSNTINNTQDNNEDNTQDNSEDNMQGNNSSSTGDKCNHNWKPATCNAPRTCSRCKATTGTALEHVWENATCDSPQTCLKCGKTIGSKLNHLFTDATCEKPKTCIYCETTSGNSLGHDYINGKCSRCNKQDSSYPKTYSVGETWIVDGQWEFTVNSVTTHYLCDDYYADREGYTTEHVVMINYTYKNLGYTNDIQDLCFNPAVFKVYDQTGEAAADDMLSCDHNLPFRECVVGTKCTASVPYILTNRSESIILVVDRYSSNGMGKQKATFILSVDD